MHKLVTLIAKTGLTALGAMRVQVGKRAATPLT